MLVLQFLWFSFDSGLCIAFAELNTGVMKKFRPSVFEQLENGGAEKVGPNKYRL
jgi:hypothetical protein